MEILLKKFKHSFELSLGGGVHCIDITLNFICMFMQNIL